MSRPSINAYYAAMLPIIASRATCPRRQVGAILVDDSGKLVSIGYNGVPSGVQHCTEHPCSGAKDVSGDNSRCIAIHAETNAVLQAADSRRRPWTRYCSVAPCFNCAKLLITAGIRKVVALELYHNDMSGVWLLEQANVKVYVYRNDDLIDWKEA